MDIKILTDSASDLPLSFFNEYDVTFFPLGVHLDGQDYLDLISIEPNEIYEAMRNGKAPKTSQVTPQAFKDVFTECAKANQPAIYIALSSMLSGTYQTAVMMKNEVLEEYPHAKLSIIDTRCASLGEGLVVKYAAELAAKEIDFEELEDKIKFFSTHMEHLFTVDDLEYLARGGRISKASAFIGGLLNIKPLLHVEDGKLVPLEKIRGKKKVLKRMIELMEERGDKLSEQTIGISHADNLEAAEALKSMIEEKFGSKTVFLNTVGATIGAHAGPGTLALFFLNEVPE